MQIFNSKGSLITDMQSWEHAFKEVDSAKHWKPGYSAHALAKHFTSPSVEDSHGLVFLKQNLTNFGYSDIIFETGKIEHESTLDEFGKGRLHDLFIRGKTGNRNLLVYVEAKVNESFGLTTEKTIFERLKNSPDSKIRQRIDRIADLLSLEYEDVQTLRYQLLTYIIGALNEAGITEEPIVYLPVISYKTENYDFMHSLNNMEDYITAMESLGFHRYNIDGTIMFENEYYTIPVISSYNVVQEASKIEVF